MGTWMAGIFGIMLIVCRLAGSRIVNYMVMALYYTLIGQ